MKICGSRRCRATLFGVRPSRIVSLELVGQATSAPHTEEARPKDPVFGYKTTNAGFPLIQVVSFRKTICE